MSTEFPSKLNKLLQNLPKGAVITDNWLAKHGISNELKRRYVSSQWLEPIGHSASKRVGDTVTWSGAVWAVLQQGIKIHVGGKTALRLLGLSHYVRVNESIILFKEPKISMPKWFSQVIPKEQISLINTGFIKNQLCISNTSIEHLDIPTSQAERAILEHLYLVGKTETFEEASHLMEALTTLRPALLQKLLEQCSSIKTKRMFLFFGDYYQYDWFNRLDLKKINLGSGNRKLVDNGVLNKEYKITIPKGFINDETSVY